MSEEWNSLSDEKKKPYIQKAEADENEKTIYDKKKKDK